jgi:DNA-binding NarL/FixJ family response regulator
MTTHLVPSQIRVLILHREAIVAHGIQVTLSVQPTLLVREGIPSQASVEQFDVIICDHDTGISLARSSSSAGQSQGTVEPKLLVLADTHAGAALHHAMTCGVHGYLPLGCSVDELVSRIHSLATMQGTKQVQDVDASGSPLTNRECEVLDLLAAGECNSAIARHLGIPLSNVKVHVKALVQKLQASNRAHAVGLASQKGLIGLSNLA